MTKTGADFLTILALGNSRHAATACSIYEKMWHHGRFGRPTFQIAPKTCADGSPSGAIVIFSIDGVGEPSHVTAFARMCGKAAGLDGTWRFIWTFAHQGGQQEVSGGSQTIDLKSGRLVQSYSCGPFPCRPGRHTPPGLLTSRDGAETGAVPSHAGGG